MVMAKPTPVVAILLSYRPRLSSALCPLPTLLCVASGVNPLSIRLLLRRQTLFWQKGVHLLNRCLQWMQHEDVHNDSDDAGEGEAAPIAGRQRSVAGGGDSPARRQPSSSCASRAITLFAFQLTKA